MADVVNPTHTILVWYSKDGADKGTPWNVRTGHGELLRAVDVQLKGDCRTRFKAEGYTELPDGPRAVIECMGEALIIGPADDAPSA